MYQVDHRDQRDGRGAKTVEYSPHDSEDVPLPEGHFNKILVAKFSPQNGCHVQDGDLLTVKPRKKLPLQDVAHKFVSVVEPTKTSKFGWVRRVKPFSFSDFKRLVKTDSEINEAEEQHILSMLSSIQSMPDGTPVAATYFSRGILEKRMVFVVHKVIFQKGRPSTNR
jgi:hypothetical protein